MYREVTMVEVKEVLRLWRAGLPKKRVAAQLGLAPRTVRRFLAAATAAGVRGDAGVVTDDEVRDTLLALQPLGGRPRGDGWAQCAAHRPTIERWLGDGLRLTKIQKLLTRQGVGITYPTSSSATYASMALSSSPRRVRPRHARGRHHRGSRSDSKRRRLPRRRAGGAHRQPEGP